MNDVKPGYLTTEFWLTVTSTLIMLLNVLGVIGTEDVASFNELAAGLIAGVIPIALYIWSRAKVKAGS